jgi:hypothetical protein
MTYDTMFTSWAAQSVKFEPQMKIQKKNGDNWFETYDWRLTFRAHFFPHIDHLGTLS